jgi:hypothetical protein
LGRLFQVSLCSSSKSTCQKHIKRKKRTLANSLMNWTRSYKVVQVNFWLTQSQIEGF